jgi:hypothetical protein
MIVMRSDCCNIVATSSFNFRLFPMSDRTKGIDFHQALEILSARASSSSSSLPASNDEEENRSRPQDAAATATPSSSCPCCSQPSSLPDSVKNLGQVLDLYASSSSENDGSPSLPSAQDLKAEQQQLDATRRRRQEELRRELQQMSIPDLLRAVLQAQQQRVAAYRSYDRCVSAGIRFLVLIICGFLSSDLVRSSLQAC